MTTFQRARTDEQRALRRRAILDAAAAMLAEMPVAELTLNELARRVGLAKSNVLRHVGSREAVLLELLDVLWREWLTALAVLLPDRVGSAESTDRRADQLAAALAASLATRPVLCDLLAAQAAVLERNVSPEVAARFKRAALDAVAGLARLVAAAVPELGEAAAGRFAAGALLVAGAAWTHARPAPAVLAVYAAEPDLAVLRMDFAPAVEELLAVLLAGLLSRGRR